MCWVVEDRLADLPYPDTQPAPYPSLFCLYSHGEGELTLGKAMSLSPRVGDLCWRMGVWGPPSMTLSPGGGRTGLGFPLTLPPHPVSLPPASSTIFRCFSVHSSLAGQGR